MKERTISNFTENNEMVKKEKWEIRFGKRLNDIEQETRKSYEEAKANLEKWLNEGLKESKEFYKELRDRVYYADKYFYEWELAQKELEQFTNETVDEQNERYENK